MLSDPGALELLRKDSALLEKCCDGGGDTFREAGFAVCPDVEKLAGGLLEVPAVLLGAMLEAPGRLSGRRLNKLGG